MHTTHVSMSMNLPMVMINGEQWVMIIVKLYEPMYSEGFYFEVVNHVTTCTGH